MAERKVSFKIDITGMSQLRNSMRGVTDMARDMNFKIVQMQERTALKMKEIERDKNRAIKTYLDSAVKDNENAAAKILSIKQKYAEQERRVLERSALAQKQAGERAAQSPTGLSLSGLGHLAQTAGYYRTGHLIRAASQFGVGSSIGDVGGTSGLSGLGAAAAGAAVGIGAIVVAAKLVEMGFQGLVGISEHLATSFMGAITQIGGARNLQQMLVEGSNTQSLAANIAANVTDKISTKQVENVINGLSKSTKYTPEEIGQGLGAYKAKTGKLLQGGFATFATKLATAGDLSMAQTGGLLGQLTGGFGLNEQQAQLVASKLWKQGKKGAVELKDATSISEALTFARKAGGGDIVKGISMEMGTVQMAQRGLGGVDAAEATTSARRFQQDLEDPKKRAKMQALLGGGPIMSTTSAGEAVFTNLVDTEARAALLEYKNPGALKSAGFDARAMRLPAGIEASAVNQPEFQNAKNDDQRLQVLKDMIEGAGKADNAMKELADSANIVKDTMDYQLKQAFNEASIALESQFVPILQNMIPTIKLFSDTLIKDKDKIGAATNDLIVVMKDLIPIILLVGEAFSAAFVKPLGEMGRGIGWFLHHNDPMNIFHGTWASDVGNHLVSAGNNMSDILSDLQQVQLDTSATPGTTRADGKPSYHKDDTMNSPSPGKDLHVNNLTVPNMTVPTLTVNNLNVTNIPALKHGNRGN